MLKPNKEGFALKEYWDCGCHDKKHHHHFKPKSKKFVKKIVKTIVTDVKFVPVVKKHVFVDVKHEQIKKPHRPHIKAHSYCPHKYY
jgi:hypothetical protein